MSSVERLAREILDARRLALGHATSPQLGASALDGGRINFRDADGNPIGGIGLGDGGVFEIDYSGGPKPPQPTPPVVTADGGIFRVDWDGSFASNIDDEGELATADLDRVEVHASMDENFVPDRVESFAGAYSSLDGGAFTFGPLPEAGTYYFRLVARSKSAQYSVPSDRVEQELAISSVDLEITDAWLTGEAAQNTADGKNSIFRGPDEPEPDPDKPFKDGDIWFEMTDDGKSIPNIWDEAAGAWVANDDYRQSEIERVQDELRQELDDIVIDGSGTKNFYQSDEPTEGMREGDLWFDVSDNNKPYIFQDGEWITVRDSFAQPGAAAEIAGVLLPNAVQNQWSNVPGFSYTASRIEAEVPAGAPSGGAKLVIPFQGTVDDSGVPVIAGDTIPTQGLPAGVSGEIFVNSPDADPTAKLHVRFEGGPWPDGTDIPFDFIVEPYTIGGSTHRLVWDTTNDAVLSTYATLVESIGFALEVNISSTEGSFVDFNTGDRFTGRLQVPGPGVANEAITTDKIAAGAITAESGIIGSIDAGTITVGEMNGARIKAGTVDADTVLVESSIGSTLIKDGAILTDHIKAGAITAESGIIGSIDANVITVGKIMGNQLDADAINGKTITGATIRTASSGSRVELTHNGLKQYNSLGATVVDMTAGSFTLEGGSITGSTIKTATSGSRVEITTQGLKQFNADDEVISEMVDGSMVMRGILEQENSTAKMQVGPAWVSDNSPGIRWFGVDDHPGHEPGLAIAMGDDRASLALQGPSKVPGKRGALLNLFDNRIYAALRDIDTKLDMGDTSTYLSYTDPSTSYNQRFYMRDRNIWLGWRNSNNTIGASLYLDNDGIGFYVNAASRRLLLDADNIKIPWLPGDTNAVPIGRVSGRLHHVNSSRRFKLLEEPITDTIEDFEDKLLSVEAKTWIDRTRAERIADYETAIAKGEEPVDKLDGCGGLERIPGVVAEDMEDAGLEMFVAYNDDGETSSVFYDRIGPALIPIVRRQRDRINSLEERVEALESRLDN